MKKRIFSVFAPLCAFSLTAQAECHEIAGVKVPDTISVEGNELNFNGGGIRSKWWMSLYVGGLYLPEELHGTSDAQKIISADKPMAITMDIVSSMITSDRMTSATVEGFKNATGGNTAPIQEEIDEFMGVFDEEIETGDHFRIAHISDKGILVYRNGEQTGSVEGGMEFKEAVFGIWLSHNPAQVGVKNAMLGKN